MNQPKHIAIVILAAGSSSRMGSAKQLLTWEGTNLLGHASKQAIASKASEVFVVLGTNYEKIQASIQHKSLNVIKNSDWEMGMGNSIACSMKALQNSQYEAVLFMLSDQPQVDTDYLNCLIDRFQLAENQIVATVYGKGLGVPALFDQVYFKELAALNGAKGAKQIIRKYSTHVFPVKPPQEFIDIDTVEVYGKLMEKNKKVIL